MSRSRDEVQAEAIDAIVRERSAGRRSTLLQMPTQTGKTRTICKYIRRGLVEWGGRFLVLAHMGELLDQFGRELDEMGIAYAVEKSERRAFEVMKSIPSIRVCLGSKDSLQDRERTVKGEVRKSARLSSWPPDFFTDVIEDECHLATADTWRKVHRHFDGAFRVGMTATIDRLDGVPLSRVFDSTAYAYPITHAIRNGHRVPFRAVLCDADIDIRGIKADAMGKLPPGELEARVGPKLEELANVVRMQLDRNRIGKAIAFLPSRALGYAFAQFLSQVEVPAEGVCGVNPDRHSIIRRHRRGDFRVLCNKKLLGMGYNDPGIDAVIDLDPTTSRAWFDQKAGRCGATREGKECGYLIYVGWQSDLDLIGPTDIFAAGDDAKVRARARTLAAKAKDADPEALLEQAREEVAAEDERERVRTERRLRYEATRREVRHRFREYDPIGVAVLGGFQPSDSPVDLGPPTPAMVARLREFGLKHPEAATRGEAEAAVRFWDERMDVGLLTPKQFNVIRKFAPPERAVFLSKREAGQVIGALMRGEHPSRLAATVERMTAEVVG